MHVLLPSSEDTYPDGAVVVKPGQELSGVPVGIRCFPVPIRPDDLRFVPGRQQEVKGSEILVLELF